MRVLHVYEMTNDSLVQLWYAGWLEADLRFCTLR